ncbi:aminomethyl-transferring glycine dehydrogenase [Luteolibacter pohnpeiensis]|uniref:Glycine dehydrogenase (decarboxylating) n=1 Tax=Luteolibacter pohnpeiensis TaxID=454153 RepID=A0A934S496_9BACT|nr:aminomethyl-transferring glycine dehydrogenase [Luteolibacter pohnpeiensis]MBK1882221.1 aminomethyl-transferring glycine dehydrogenase [Luteolibacter pohnpeiensis]
MSARLDFRSRHIGPFGSEREEMLRDIGYESLSALADAAVPAGIRLDDSLNLPEPKSEQEALTWLKSIMGKNQVVKSFIGQGYHGTHVPGVIQRNILENPGWYTAYTPYQAEIAQGRLEALLNFQTMITDLTGLDIANASLLDEGTAAAEAVTLALSSKPKGKAIWVSDRCHPQTIDVLLTRTEPLGLEVIIGDWEKFEPTEGVFAALVQYPDTRGRIDDFEAFFRKNTENGIVNIVAADVLALTVLKAPGEFGADICVGSSQRFGVPMGFGGPHAGFMACKDALKRKMPGRIIGVSVDPYGKPGYRLALQTREQHIRRDKATSNICTAQVLLAVMASMFAVYHGPEGLIHIANEVHSKTAALKAALEKAGIAIEEGPFFDTLVAKVPGKAATYLAAALEAGFNLRSIDADHLGISCDETTTLEEIAALAAAFGASAPEASTGTAWPDSLSRNTPFLTQKAFNSYHSETEMLRYLKRLESRDLALNESMIALGSCTMKLNATSEMMPLSWPEVSSIHPFAPEAQTVGYREMLSLLEDWLAEITGFAAVSLQPNAGSQGEYAGLLAIRSYHKSRGDDHRNICLIPVSAHGTNPASAVMVGMKVVGVKCDENGNIDMQDLAALTEKHRDNLAALMVTYPSTHGVFEETIRSICEIIHEAGGQVYMDGANMNAQVGLTSPGFIGADVCHLNLHKTFCIPHGGGGPGVGPIGVASQLVPFLPGHATLENKANAVCSAPWGSASINTISWMYIAMMGTEGLTEATQSAILGANYIARRLAEFFPILYTGNEGLVAHECIIDVRPLSDQSGVTVEDVAKRLMDYGFHSPTMSWPVGGTLMIEPTESESKAELDRFCDAMISIHGEITAIIRGEADANDNLLKNAPHPTEVICGNEWTHVYTREQAAFPLPYLRQHKFWPYLGRIDNVHGDRNLVCTCDTVEAYAAAAGA